MVAFVDPETGAASDLEHCPLSEPDTHTWALIETVKRWESGQIRIDYERLCDMPSLFLETVDFMRACDAQAKQEK